MLSGLMRLLKNQSKKRRFLMKNASSDSISNRKISIFKMSIIEEFASVQKNTLSKYVKGHAKNCKRVPSI